VRIDGAQRAPLQRQSFAWEQRPALTGFWST
jgi:hypothetical protein